VGIVAGAVVIAGVVAAIMLARAALSTADVLQ
jgi:hypothetical protein